MEEEEEEETEETDSICVTVDLGAGVDTVSTAEETPSGWLVKELNVVERIDVADVDVEVVLLELDTVVEVRLDMEDDVLVSEAKEVAEVVDWVVEVEELSDVVVLAEAEIGEAEPASITGTRRKERFFIKRLRFPWSRR